MTVIAPAQGTGQAATPFVAFPALISSGIYKIGADGAPEELWTSRDDVVYSLGIGGDGRLLAGLGNTGALLAIDGRGVFAQLAKAGSAQITGIVRKSAGKIFLCTANPGKLISLGPEYEPEGTYESRSFDAQLFSQWGRVEWWSPPSTAGNNAQEQGAAAGILCAQRKHRRSGQGMVEVVWTVFNQWNADRSAGGAIRAVESGDSRRAAGRWH